MKINELYFESYVREDFENWLLKGEQVYRFQGLNSIIYVEPWLKLDGMVEGEAAPSIYEHDILDAIELDCDDPSTRVVRKSKMGSKITISPLMTSISVL